MTDEAYKRLQEISLPGEWVIESPFRTRTIRDSALSVNDHGRSTTKS